MKTGYILLLLVALSMGAFAQSSTTINGHDHPELIPDSAAALAVFSVHSKLDTANIANTERHHAKLGLSDADRILYVGAMTAFAATNSKGQAATYSTLLSTLSKDGQAKLKAFIQAEKGHMQYSTQKPIPQEVQ